MGTLFGFFLASYTGVLLSATALPFWSDARLMGALFLASGASTGMAAISLLLYLSGDSAGEGFEKVKRADRFAIVFEMAVLVLFLVLLGGAAAPLLSGHLAPLFWGGLVALGLVIPLLLDLAGRAAGARGGPRGPGPGGRLRPALRHRDEPRLSPAVRPRRTRGPARGPFLYTEVGSHRAMRTYFHSRAAGSRKSRARSSGSSR